MPAPQDWEDHTGTSYVMDVTATVTCPDTDASKSVELSAVGKPLTDLFGFMSL